MAKAASGWHRVNPASAAAKARRAKYRSAEHRAERARRVAITRPSDLCGYCRRPLGSDRSSWHLPHNEAGTAYLPGMWHAACNRKEAARRGALIANAKRKAKRVGVTRLTW